MPLSILNPSYNQSSTELSNKQPSKPKFTLNGTIESTLDNTSGDTLYNTLKIKNKATLKAVFLFHCLTDSEFFLSESIRTCVSDFRRLLAAPLAKPVLATEI